jgi:hypothetical protein
VVEVASAHLGLVLVDPIQVGHQLARRHLQWTLAPSAFRIVVGEPASTVADLSIEKCLGHGGRVSLNRRPELASSLHLLYNIHLSLGWLLNSFVLIFSLFLLDWCVFISRRFFLVLCFLLFIFVCFLGVFLSEDRFINFHGVLRDHLNFVFLIWNFFILNFSIRWIFHFIHNMGLEIILTHVSDILFAVFILNCTND